MEPRKWSPPAIPPSQGRAADPPDASGRSARSEWGAIEYVVSFLSYMLFFGLIAAFLRTLFPIDLGLFLFFTKDELIEWALRKVGIRLVPESLGATFISAFVWLTGASILFARWKGSAPAWLASFGPPSPPSWYVIAGLAVGCAVLVAISTAVARKLLPRIGIAPGTATWEITRGLIGLGILGLVILLGFTMASD